MDAITVTEEEEDGDGTGTAATFDLRLLTSHLPILLLTNDAGEIRRVGCLASPPSMRLFARHASDTL